MYLNYHLGSNKKCKVYWLINYAFNHYPCRAVEKLLAMGGSILNVTKIDGFTTLHIAAINDHREIAKLLLEQV